MAVFKNGSAIVGCNPLLNTDFPDPDVIRVEHTYYMISTTMYFMPGGVILKSYDLVNWEIAARVFHVLDDVDTQRMDNGKDAYGKGMWAASLRYHEGMFYVCFVANDTGKTYLYRAKSIYGPWVVHTIEGFYHDPSLLFDDGRVYIFYGNRSIRVKELNADLTAPMPGGVDREVVNDKDHPRLGYEGTHAYRINGKIYLFFIHSLRSEWKRVQACFVSDSVEGAFVGGDVLDDDMGFHNMGVAQGGIVDTPEGDWYAVLFQDRGAVGRVPVLVPVTWENDYPLFHKVPQCPGVLSTRPGTVYAPVVDSDDFTAPALKNVWEWNHAPKDGLWEKRHGAYVIRTGSAKGNLLRAHNTLTQRSRYPSCEARVTVRAADLREGDCAGLCALQSQYGFIGLAKENGEYYLVMVARNEKDSEGGAEQARLRWEGSEATLAVRMDFTDMRDLATFWYLHNGEWKQLAGAHQMRFTLDHFTGYRFGLFLFATKEAGGSAAFSDFVYGRAEKGASR